VSELQELYFGSKTSDYRSTITYIFRWELFQCTLGFSVGFICATCV